MECIRTISHDHVLLCRLVRDAHKKGANIVLIQVCILEPWLPLVVFFQIVSVCWDHLIDA